MAKLIKENGYQTVDLTEIRESLASLQIELDKWPVERQGRTEQLLSQSVLSGEEKEELLKDLDHYFEKQKKDYGYTSRDLIVLSPEVEGLEQMLAKFDRCHSHSDDEVRFIVDGEGIFGFVTPDGRQLALTVESEEYIRVPANTEHWFELTAQNRIKAVRYFAGTEGWVPEYTDTEIKVR